MISKELSKEMIQERSKALIESLKKHEENLQELARRFLSAVSSELNVGQGLFYLVDYSEGEAQIVSLATYACHRPEARRLSFRPGEGLVGQVASDGQGLCFQNVPEVYMSMGSGLGHSAPSSLVILPLKKGDQVSGVIELASFSGFHEGALDFLAPLQEFLGTCCAGQDSTLNKKAS